MERNIFHEFNVERLSPYLRVRRGRSDLAAAQEATRAMMRARRPELCPPPPHHHRRTTLEYSATFTADFSDLM